MNKSELELWGRPNAYNVQKALWLLAELELDFKLHDVGSQPGDLDSPDFLALNPNARIPVLRDGEAVIWESNSVLRYLANRFESVELYPVEPLARSQVERWMDWELASLQPAFIDLFWGYYRKPASARDCAVIEADKQRCEQFYARLDQHLTGREYLAGNYFSLADICCAVSLYRYFNMGLEVARPASLMRWYDRLSQRSTFQAVVMQPFDELAGRIEF